MKNITTVLFDLDGTLIKTWPFICGSFRYVLSHFGLSDAGLSDSKMRHCGLYEAYEHLGVSKDRHDKAGKLHIQFQSDPVNLNTLEHCQHAEKVLQELHRQGFNLGIVSNRQKNHRDLLRHCRLEHYFQCVIGHEHAGVGKPNPKGIQLALSHFKVDADQAVIIGDTIADIKAGKNAGILTVAIDGSECREDLIAAKPDYLFDDLGALLPLLVKT